MEKRTLSQIEEQETVIDQFGVVWLEVGGWLLSWNKELKRFYCWGAPENVLDIPDRDAYPDMQSPPSYGERQIQSARMTGTPQWTITPATQP